MSDPKADAKKSVIPWKDRPIVGLVLREPVTFGAASAKRFHVDGTDGAVLARAGLQGQSSDAIVREMAWAVPGLSVVVSGQLRGTPARKFSNVIVLGPGDTTAIDPGE